MSGEFSHPVPGQDRHYLVMAAATTAHLPSAPLGLACHGPPAGQRRGGLQKAFLPSCHTVFCPKILWALAPKLIQDYCILTVTPGHSYHRATRLCQHCQLERSCSGAISPSRPYLPGHLVPHGLPGTGERQRQQQQDPQGMAHIPLWHPDPFSPHQGQAKSSPLVPTPLTFLPCSPAGPRGPCKGGWRRCDLQPGRANAQDDERRSPLECPWGSAFHQLSQRTHPVSWVPRASRQPWEAFCSIALHIEKVTAMLMRQGCPRDGNGYLQSSGGSALSMDHPPTSYLLSFEARGSSRSSRPRVPRQALQESTAQSP